MTDWSDEVKARDSFLSKIKVDASGCWIWGGCIGKRDGYARFTRPGLSRLAHRAGYQIFRGGIPAGMVLDHVCRVRSCVNPDHLRVVTNRENVLAEGSLSLPKKNTEKPCCPRCGSSYSIRSNKERVCWPCFYDQKKKYMARRPDLRIRRRVYDAKYRASRRSA